VALKTPAELAANDHGERIRSATSPWRAFASGLAQVHDLAALIVRPRAASTERSRRSPPIARAGWQYSHHIIRRDPSAAAERTIVDAKSLASPSNASTSSLSDR
jgi:hypothetical protein